MQSPPRQPGQTWSRRVLVAAGVYNLVWGLAIIVFPSALFRFAEMELPRYPQIWQCVGMIVGVYGLGYLIAASDPYRHWPITLVGLLGKIFGPIGFLGALIQGDLPLAFGLTIITNDLIWWIPFAAILYQAFKQHNNRASASEAEFSQVIAEKASHRGPTLYELSCQNPTLVVFLRHTGCTFCRETVAELARQRAEIEARGLQLAVVHMSQPLAAAQFLSRYGLESIHRFSDPECELYQAFGLQRGTFCQLFGPKVWWRGMGSALLTRHGIGLLSGDGFRLAGAFLLDCGKIVAAQRAETAADQADYLAMAERCGIACTAPQISTGRPRLTTTRNVHSAPAV